LAFHARVAGNALAIAIRELTDGPAMREAATARLAALLGHGGEHDRLNRELFQRILSGKPPADRARLLAHLRQTARDKLMLANPRYLSAQDE
jgi:hypothetical protein